VTPAIHPDSIPFPFLSFLFHSVLRWSSARPIHPSDSDRSAAITTTNTTATVEVWFGVVASRPGGSVPPFRSGVSHRNPIQCAREPGTPPAATIAAALSASCSAMQAG